MVDSVAVVGGGVMGTGIAHAFLLSGAEVTLVDASPELAGRSVRTVRGIVDGGVARGKLTVDDAAAISGRLRTGASVDEMPYGLDLAVEAVPERVALKHDILARMAARRPRLLATNTSALSIDMLAEAVPDKANFLGLHFFNPVWASLLVEIVVGKSTSAAARAAALDTVAAIGKTPIVVTDVPGFATSRLGIALGLEAMRMLEDGVASAADIDQAMKLGYKHPVGPLMLTDIVGLDVRLDVSRNLSEAYGQRFAPPRILLGLVAAGDLGRKVGLGFYKWDGDVPKPRTS